MMSPCTPISSLNEFNLTPQFHSKLKILNLKRYFPVHARQNKLLMIFVLQRMLILKIFLTNYRCFLKTSQPSSEKDNVLFVSTSFSSDDVGLISNSVPSSIDTRMMHASSQTDIFDSVRILHAVKLVMERSSHLTFYCDVLQQQVSISSLFLMVFFLYKKIDI